MARKGVSRVVRQPAPTPGPQRWRMLLVSGDGECELVGTEIVTAIEQCRSQLGGLEAIVVPSTEGYLERTAIAWAELEKVHVVVSTPPVHPSGDRTSAALRSWALHWLGRDDRTAALVHVSNSCPPTLPREAKLHWRALGTIVEASARALKRRVTVM